MKPTIRAMQVREAKDFLVTQTAEQAALEGVPLSDLEKRMMYFTEGPDAVEDPVKLNDEFEAQYDSEEYESKVSRLLHRAYLRAKKEDAQRVESWKDAIRVLRKGDHYILVLWGAGRGGRGPSGIPPRIRVFTYLMITLGVALMLGVAYLSKTSARPAHPHLLLAVFIVMVAAGYIFPRQIGRLGGWILQKAIFPFIEEKSEKES
jgi:hypothetical protein